ncbi:hypothetical protein JTB14_016028 [Gonioctena quinquepunctata]|nr:hypothetical protein JTB14_016028 [Gonioctena quinquepunctata]
MKKQQDLSNEQLFNMLRDVICGMEYIASQKIVHRDLATRNIFVSSIFECKIGDFGSCCYIDDCNGTYEDKTEKVFLDLNVPPEAKITQIFSMKTDVWAMGLLIWDAFIRASSKSSMPLFCFELVEAYTIFSNTGQLPMPSRCPADIYLYVREKLMHDDPSQRPTFAEINQKFSKFNKAGSRSYAVTS